MHADLGISRAWPHYVILVGIILIGPKLREEGRGHSKKCREEPDERDVDGVRPGPGHILALGPLGVLHKEMEGEEHSSQGQEEQEAVVEIPAKGLYYYASSVTLRNLTF